MIYLIGQQTKIWGTPKKLGSCRRGSLAAWPLPSFSAPEVPPYHEELFFSFSYPTSQPSPRCPSPLHFNCLFCHYSVETPFFQLCRSSAQIVFAKAAPPRSTSGFMRLPQLLAFDTSRHQFGGGRALRTTLYQIPMRPSEIWIWPNVSHFAWESAQWLMKDLKEIFTSYLTKWWTLQDFKGSNHAN